MPIPVMCPCGKQYTFKDEFAGQRARCPACGHALTIQAPVKKGATPSIPITPSDATGTQPLLERIGRRTMLICGAIAWGFARSGFMLMLTAAMMILIYPVSVGLVLPAVAFIDFTEGVTGVARMPAFLFCVTLTVVCEYFAVFGTLGWIKGFVAGNGKMGWAEFKRSCLVDKLMMGRTFFIGAGVVLVAGIISAAIMEVLSLIGLRP